MVLIYAIAIRGHFIELYESIPALLGLYETVAKVSIGFDGHKPLFEAELDPDSLDCTSTLDLIAEGGQVSR